MNNFVFFSVETPFSEMGQDFKILRRFHLKK